MSAADEPAKSTIAKIDATAVGVLQLLVGTTMIAAVVVNFANVIFRYVLFRPFIWAEEVMQFLHVWAVMLGAAVITRHGRHLRMDAIYFFAPAPIRRAADLLNTIVALAVAFYVMAQAVDIIRMLGRTGQRSVIAGIPMNLMYMAVLIGFGCTAGFLLSWLVRRARGQLGDPGDTVAERAREVG